MHFTGLLLLFSTIQLAIAGFHHSCSIKVPRAIFSHAEAITDAFITVIVSPKLTVPAAVLIYNEKDRPLTNIPDVGAPENEGWTDFGVCTFAALKAEKCDTLGKFAVQFDNEEVEERTVNELVKGNQKHPAVFPLKGTGTFCYLYHLPDEAEEELTLKKELTVVMVPRVPLVNIASDLFMNYYGRFIHVVVQLILALFIYSRKLKGEPSQLSYKPYRYFFNILILSSLLNLIHIWYFHRQVDAFIAGDSDGFKTIFRYSRNISEVLEEIVVYMIAYQFLNRDAPGFRIDFRKNRHGYWFLGLIVWTSIILPIAVSYRYQILFTIVDETKGKRISSKYFNFIHYLIESLNFINFAAIWFVLYNVSQATETKLANLQHYSRRFKLTRIYVGSSAVAIKIFGFLLGHFIFPLVYKFSEFIRNLFDDGFDPEASLFPWFLLLVLKFLVCSLKNFEIFALPLVTVITLSLWWSYDEKEDEYVELSTVHTS